MTLSQRLRKAMRYTRLDADRELLTEAADEIDALQARAQVQGEPVTVAVDHFDNGPFEAYTNRIHPPVEIGAKLYTTPQPAQATQTKVTDGIRPEDFTVDVVVKPMGGFAPVNTQGVRVTHKPTGVSVTCDAARSQHMNRHQAFEKLSAILAQQPAASEPVKAAPYNPTEEMRCAMKRIDPALSSEQCRALWSAAWSASPSTHPVPSVPSEPVLDVRCEGCGYMTHHREHMGCVRAAKQHTHPAPSVPDDVVHLRNALILAANRLDRLTLELKYDSQARADAIEWASDAMLAAK